MRLAHRPLLGPAVSPLSRAPIFTTDNQPKSILMKRPTEEIIEIFAEAARSGAHLETAADLAQVPVERARAWLYWGETARRGSSFNRFYWAWKQAEAEFEARCVRGLRDGAEGWQRFARLLAERTPERWGKEAEPAEDDLLRMSE